MIRLRRWELFLEKKKKARSLDVVMSRLRSYDPLTISEVIPGPFLFERRELVSATVIGVGH
jgi:hypothetical protein